MSSSAMKQVSARGKEGVGFWSVSHIHFRLVFFHGLVFFQAQIAQKHIIATARENLFHDSQTSQLIKVQDITFPSRKDVQHSLIQATTIMSLPLFIFLITKT